MPVIKVFITTLVLFVAAGELTACGKKGDLEPPPTNEESQKKEDTRKKPS